MMALTEDLVRACAAEVAGTLQLTYQGMQLDLEQPFRRATMHELVQEATGAHLRPVHVVPLLCNGAPSFAVGLARTWAPMSVSFYKSGLFDTSIKQAEKLR